MAAAMGLLLSDAAADAADSSAVLVSSSSYTPTVVAGLEDDVDAGVGRVARPGANTARGMTKEWAVEEEEEEEEEEATEKTRTKTDATAAAGWRRLNWRRNVVVIVLLS